MKLLSSKNDFFNLIEIQDKIIIFCFHDWSTHSAIAKKIVEDWEFESKRDVYLIDASIMDQDSYFIQWLINQEEDDWSKEKIMKVNKYSPQKRVHGYGEICWIVNKKIIGFESIYSALKPRDLEHRTKDLF